jgi:hypothetical protein
MLEASTILDLHDDANHRWHRTAPSASPPTPVGASEPLDHLIRAQHQANFELWHEEDLARDPLATDAELARVKHAIDALNQRRNDLVERIDLALLQEAGTQDSEAPLHSETPGLMIDRLSILALKLYHTAEEAHRATASEAHREKNRARLVLLTEQRADLAACLDALWAQVLAGRRRFKLYRQLKMYNDPELNPAVYSRQSR